MVTHCPQLGSTLPRSVRFWKVDLTYFLVICQRLTLIWQKIKAPGPILVPVVAGVSCLDLSMIFHLRSYYNYDFMHCSYIEQSTTFENVSACSECPTMKYACSSLRRKEKYCSCSEISKVKSFGVQPKVSGINMPPKSKRTWHSNCHHVSSREKQLSNI